MNTVRKNNTAKTQKGARKWGIPLLIILTALLAFVLLLLFLMKPPLAEPSPTEFPETHPTGQTTADATWQTEQVETTSQAVQTEPDLTEPPTEPAQTVPQETTQPETEPPVNTEQTKAPAPTETTAPPGDSDASVGTPAPTAPPAPPKQEESKDEPKEEDTVRLRCDHFSIFSGQFVEDGRDELVENVAAMLVTNVSDRFLDVATVEYNIDGKKATFVVTGLPAGRSAWVMEASRMTVTPDSVFTYLNETTSYRDDISPTTNMVSITANGNMLTAINNSDETLTGLYVYYRTVHSDGNFFGGITYLVNFGTLEPGETVETMGGHYNEYSEIVRIGWS